MHKQMANYRSVKLDKATCQQIAEEIMETYDLKNLPKNGLTAQLFLKFFLISQHEVKVLFINTSEETKRPIE